MIEFFIVVLVAIAIFLALGLVRVVLGPSYADRMLAMQLISTNGVAMLALLAVIQSEPNYLNVALILALLASLALVTFTRIIRAIA